MEPVLNNSPSGTSLVVQGLRLHVPNAGGLGLISGQGTRSHMLQLRVHMLQQKLQPNKLKKENSPANAGDIKDTGFDPWVMKIPWRKSWKPTPVFLPGESHRQRSLAGYSPWGLQESDTTQWLTHMKGPRCYARWVGWSLSFGAVCYRFCFCFIGLVSILERLFWDQNRGWIRDSETSWGVTAMCQVKEGECVNWERGAGCAQVKGEEGFGWRDLGGRLTEPENQSDMEVKGSW